MPNRKHVYSLAFQQTIRAKRTWHRAKGFHKTSSPPKPWCQGVKWHHLDIETIKVGTLRESQQNHRNVLKRHRHQRGMCPFHYAPPRPLDKKRIWWVRPVCNFNRTKEYGSFTIRTQWKGGENVEGKVLRTYGSSNDSPISSICPIRANLFSKEPFGKNRFNCKIDPYCMPRVALCKRPNVPWNVPIQTTPSIILWSS